MRWVPVLACMVALSACTEESAQPPVPAPTATGTAAAQPSPEPNEASSGARTVMEETDDFLFEYAYPAEAGEIAGLAALLDRRLEVRRADLARSSAQAQRDARSDGFPYNKHSYSAEWQVVAQTPRFLSLSNEFTTFGGGAHGNYGMESLLWDKAAERALRPTALFTSPASLEEALGERYCTALDALREERREAPVEPGEGTFSDCPGIDELTVLLGSASGSRFDRMTLYAGPYVAGPYAEGAYKVDLPVDDAVLEAVRPEYRESFATRN